MKNISYDYFSKDYSHPADRRRFVGFIKNHNFLINEYKKPYDLKIITQCSDLSNIKNIKSDKKIIFDLCDAILEEKNYLKKYLRGVIKFFSRQHKYLSFSYDKLIIEACKKANVVVCTSQSQKKILNKYSQNVHVIEDILDGEILFNKTSYKKNENFKIVWEGLSSNLEHLKFFADVFLKLEKLLNIEIHIITDELIENINHKIKISAVKKIKKMFKNNKNVFFHKWQAKSFTKIISKCDLAIIPGNKRIPIFENKSANKLLIFWKIGIPVLTSFNHEYYLHQKNINLDFVCFNETDWINKITDYYNDEKKRRNMGTIGKNYAYAYYSDDHIIAKWNKILKDINFIE